MGSSIELSLNDVSSHDGYDDDDNDGGNDDCSIYDDEI